MMKVRKLTSEQQHDHPQQAPDDVADHLLSYPSSDSEYSEAPARSRRGLEFIALAVGSLAT